MKKFKTSLLAAMLILCFSAVGFAGHRGFGDDKNRGPGHHERTPMTEQQKKEHIDFLTEKNKLHADFLKGEAKAGRISKAEADARITLMNEHLKRMNDSNFERRIITDEERAAREQYREKVRALEIEHVKKGMASGSISQERGERMIQRLENQDDFKRGPGNFHSRGDRFCGN